jgi:sucrose phosphorylase
MPGIPQIWYLDIFAGKNDYVGVEKAGKNGHKEINRTTLSLEAIQEGLKKEVVLKQLDMLRLRNTCKAFSGTLEFGQTSENELNLIWRNGAELAQLKANLTTHEFSIQYTESDEVKTL